MVQQFSFDGGGIAAKYDEILVPVMFGPWSEMLLAQVPPQPHRRVLDVATGTGVVAEPSGIVATSAG